MRFFRLSWQEIPSTAFSSIDEKQYEYTFTIDRNRTFTINRTSGPFSPSVKIDLTASSFEESPFDGWMNDYALRFWHGKCSSRWPGWMACCAGIFMTLSFQSVYNTGRILHGISK
jgi:hypothetical protein